ncbi:uncharacterized protein C8A04DRAFT_35346 [Dichotomopilus funicola]|uniref:Actin-like ATPase domain-containing protein n=1 Tax=Dichotomopilus funicola TaxID=1934379 RepID=A0AAN6V790_9PEZI|nr:hypothetical protein C8A04DRAFT_35346 [Dichotomopilus funicola]
MPSTKKPKPTGNTVIIGIDFGTTFSGVAYTWSGKTERIKGISSWDSQLHSNSNENKTPTAVSFKSKGRINWGYGIPSDAQQIQGLIPEDVRESVKVKEARKALKEQNKTVIEITSVYLRHLRNRCVQRITETVSRNLINFSKFHIAVERAGMLGERIASETQLSFISEPEAAALATLSEMDGRADVENGDCFVVADCGGGTADLINYEVVSTNPMMVKECVKGQGKLINVPSYLGGLCGAKFGNARWNKLKATSKKNLIETEWEHMIKPEFDGRNKTWEIRLPFECLDLNVFNPVVDKIGSVVNEQVHSVLAKKKVNPKYIVFVGGFGQSRYLFNSLKKAVPSDIDILQSRGSGPWTAICRGAVVHAIALNGFPGLSVGVQTKVSRVNCGFMWNVYWDPEQHDRWDKAWDKDRHEWVAEDQMNWLLKMKYTTIYSTSVSSPPKRWNRTMEKLCKIKWETSINIQSLPTFTNSDGKVYHELEYEVEMTCVAGSVDFAVYHEGERQGSRNVEIDYENRP